MDANRDGRIDRVAAEQILSGERPPPTEIGAILAAAAAPAARSELSGEDAAVAAFRAHASHEGPRLGRTRIRLAAAAVVIVAIAAGTAAAAATGVVPTLRPHQNSPHRPSSTTTAPTDGPTSPRATTAPTGSPVSPKNVNGLRGLCHAYLQAERNGRTPPPADDRLRLAAGDQNLTPFCDALLGQATPSHKPHPTGKPSSHHPTGRPSGRPSKAHGQE